jgi:hypothetical protein
MGQIKHYNNGKWTIYTSGEGLSGYTGVTDTYYVGPDLNNDGNLTKANPDGSLVNLEKPNVGFTGFTYEIGQYVADEGGVIAHRWLSTSAGGSPTAGTVQNYLVVDTQNIGSSVYWSNPAETPGLTNALSTWNGQGNTDVIEVAGPAAGIDANSAAMLCVNSSNNGKTDWYLPTIDELNKVFNNRWEIAQGIEAATGTPLAFNIYWSSLEYLAGSAWVFYFDNGGAYVNFKSGTLYVRAVRKFSI